MVGLIATGRMLHHLEEVEGLSLKATQVCILDEADRLFEMGLFEQVIPRPCLCMVMQGHAC